MGFKSGFGSSETTSTTVTSETTVSSSEGLQAGGTAIFSHATSIKASGSISAAGNVSGTADLTANRVSGSARGMTTLGTALFSNSTSIKTSGSITMEGVLSSSDGITVGGDAIHTANVKVSGSVTIEGQTTLKVKTTYLEGDLDLSSVATALGWSGAMIAMDQNGGSRTITLPTATTSAEASAIAGWYIEVFNAYAGSNACTIIRGDTSNDFLQGSVAAHGQDGLSGLTIGSNVVTFASGDSVEGDYVKVLCYSADASNTYFIATGASNT